MVTECLDPDQTEIARSIAVTENSDAACALLHAQHMNDWNLLDPSPARSPPPRYGVLSPDDQQATIANSITPPLGDRDPIFEPANCVRRRTQVPAVRQRSLQDARSLLGPPGSRQDTESRRADRAAHCPRAGLASAYLQEECYRNHTFGAQALIQINVWYFWRCGPSCLSREQLSPSIIEPRNVCALS